MNRLAIVTLGFAAITLMACDQLGGGEDETATEEENLPPAEVNLPEVPPLELLDTPRQYDDGSYSVIGLRLNRDELFGQTLSVTGLLEEVYVCDSVVEQQAAIAAQNLDEDDPVPEIDRAGCLFPHLYIVDNLRSMQRFLIVGYDWEHYEPQLVVGNRYTFTGRFAQRSRGHMSPENGLLNTFEITGEGVVPPPDPNAETE